MTIERSIGQYQVLEKLGEGGMGEVFKGFDTLLEREVAIKSLRPELSSRSDVVERFRVEAVALGRLNNPHIATLYAFLQDEGQFFMMLEFVRGETLGKLIARCGKLPWAEAVDLAAQALDGLEHAHRLGVVHRDIKPANIMLAQGNQVKVMDFGIARLLERARLTRTGHLIGTLEYMSPEQVQGRDADARADIYSMGIVLYEMLTGHVPFRKDSDYDLIRSQVEEAPQPIRSLTADIPETLESIVLKALSKNPDDRFSSAADFQSALYGLISKPGYSPPHKERPAPPETRYVPPSSPYEHPRRPLPSEPVVNKAGAILPIKALFLTFWKNYPGLIVLSVLVVVSVALVAKALWVGLPVQAEKNISQEKQQAAIVRASPADRLTPSRSAQPSSEPTITAPIATHAEQAPAELSDLQRIQLQKFIQGEQPDDQQDGSSSYSKPKPATSPSEKAARARNDGVRSSEKSVSAQEKTDNSGWSIVPGPTQKIR